MSVSDGMFHNNCTLKIRVKDINDNSPIFNPASYEASVAEVGCLFKGPLGKIIPICSSIPQEIKFIALNCTVLHYRN